MFSLTIEDSNGQIAEKFTFDHGSYRVGRQEDCDIVLPSSSVSRRHAKIYVEGGRCYIEDLDSANGVTVDGQRVAGQRHLGTASQIRIGDYYLYLEYTGDGDLAEDNRDTLYISDDAEHNKLVRVNDEFAGEEFRLSEVKNTIGRTDDNFILLSDPSISREHAVVRRNGDSYLLDDRGSSNGTRVNGREITHPRELEPGDLVEFGNVQFVFAQGDEEIDPSQYASSRFGGGGLLVAAVVTVVVVVGVVAAGLLVYGFRSYSEPQSGEVTAESSTSPESKVDALMKRGKAHLEGEEWSRAIEVFNDVLSRSPNHERAESLRNRARRARDARDSFERGVKFSENGEHEKALEVLREISNDTPAHEDAQSVLEHVRKTIAFELHENAKPVVNRDAPDDEEVARARKDLERAIELAPKGSKIAEKAKTTLEKLEE